MIKFCVNCAKDNAVKRDPVSGNYICSVCGTAVAAVAEALKTGTNINGFLIEGELGRGGMGVVYKARQISLDRLVAFKVLNDAFSEDAEFVDRFFKEARAAATLNHPNIVQVYDAGSTTDGIYYFVMELVVGESLESRIHREGSLAPLDALNVAARVAEALDYAWDTRQLTHGDIKPDNVMLNSSGGVKLADLGLAKTIHDTSARDEGILATPLYAAPEIIAGDIDKVDYRADIYSFGAALYHMLSGAPPFPYEDADRVMRCHLNDPPPLLRERIPDIHLQLSNFVDQLLRKNPDERPSSWKKVLKRLEKLSESIAEGRAIATETAVAETEQKSSLFFRISRYAAVLMAVALVGLIVYRKVAERNKPRPAFIPAVLPTTPVKAPTPSISPAKSPTTKPTTTKPAAPVAKRKFYPDDWLSVKREARELVLAKAIALTREYLAATGKQGSPDARAYLDRALKLESQANALIAELKKTNIAALDMDRATKLKREIVELTASVKTGNDAVFNDAEKKLDARVEALANSQENKAISDDLRRKREEEERLRQGRLAALKTQYQREIQSNAAIDRYYLALGAFADERRKKSAIATLEKQLAALQTEANAVPEAFSRRVRLLLQAVLPSSDKQVDLMLKREKSLLQKSLPFSTRFPRQAKVAEIDAKRLKLFWKIDEAKVGGVLAWKSLSENQWTALLEKRILDEDELGTMSDEDITIALSCLIFRVGPEDFAATVDRFSKLSEEDRRTWKALSRDFGRAKTEAEAVGCWEKILKAKEEKDIGALTRALGVFRSDHAKTQCYERYAPLIAVLAKRLELLYPAAEALALKRDAGRATNAKELIALGVVARGRYGAATQQFQEFGLAGVEEKEQEALNNVIATSKDTLKDNKLPFTRWERNEPGDAKVFLKRLMESAFLKSADYAPLLRSFEAAVELEYGDWKRADELFANENAMKIGELVKIDKLDANFRTWAAAIIYAKGLIAARFGDAEGRRYAALALMEMTRLAENNQRRAKSAVFALDLTRRTRQLSLAKELSQAYPFPEAAEELDLADAHVALERMLTRYADTEADNKKLAAATLNAIDSLSKSFTLVEKLANDRDWLTATAGLLSGAELDNRKVFRLSGLTPYFKDICAGAMLNAIARRCLANKTPENLDELMKLPKDGLSDNIVSGALWEAILTVKLALALTKQSANVDAVLQEALDDRSPATLNLYPIVILARLAVAVSDRQLSEKDAATAARRFLDASPLTAEHERQVAALFGADNPLGAVKAAFEKAPYPNGYWTGVIAALANLHKPAEVAAVTNYLLAADRKACWSPEQTLLLQRLNRLMTERKQEETKKARDDREQEQWLSNEYLSLGPPTPE